MFFVSSSFSIRFLASCVLSYHVVGTLSRPVRHFSRLPYHRSSDLSRFLLNSLYLSLLFFIANSCWFSGWLWFSPFVLTLIFASFWYRYRYLCFSYYCCRVSWFPIRSSLMDFIIFHGFCFYLHLFIRQKNSSLTIYIEYRIKLTCLSMTWSLSTNC